MNDNNNNKLDVMTMHHYNNITEVMDSLEEVREQLQYNAIYVKGVGIIFDEVHLETIIKAIDSYKANKLGSSTRAERPEVTKKLDLIHKYLEMGYKDIDVMKMFNISQSTYYRYKKLLKEQGRI